MARRALAAGLAGLGLAGLYVSRRQILARALGIRPAEHRVRIFRDIPIPMPDGVILYADHYAPQGQGSFPTILVRTPYGRAAEMGIFALFFDWLPMLFAERGYHVINQSVRGRYRSGGSFDPFVHEASDGRATMEWIGEQPWFDGNLGMWGASYLGYAQWAVAADAPDYLKAIVPIVTSSRFSRLFYPDGAFAFESSLRWAYLTHHMGGAEGKFDWKAIQRLGPLSEAILAEALAHRPLAEADAKALGAPVEFFQRWLHDVDAEGDYWRRVDAHRGLGRVKAAVHLVAGWHDIFLGGQLADYTALLAAGRTPYLTVLPRTHMDSALVTEGVREGLWWLDAHLKGHRELLDRRPVRFALMGSHEWHEMDFWPPPARFTRHYLHADGLLSTSPPAEQSPPDRYTYDPSDPTPAIGGPVLSQAGGPRDQRPIEARPDVLTFTSAPLAADVDVIGPVRLDLYARSSQPHTDFIGRLCVVSADGLSLNLCEGICRVAPGKGEAQPDGSLRLEVDMWATAQRFRRGERIRLQICSAAHPRLAANLGHGLGHGVGTSGSPAEQTIFHDAAHPSALVLPIVDDQVRERMAGADLN